MWCCHSMQGMIVGELNVDENGRGYLVGGFCKLRKYVFKHIAAVKMFVREPCSEINL